MTQAEVRKCPLIYFWNSCGDTRERLFRKALEALIARRAKQHHILADRLLGYLNQSEPSNKSLPDVP